MTNSEVLDNFLAGHLTSGQHNASKNLRIEGFQLVNYSTVIAKWSDGKILLNERKYSSTTTKHQNYIKLHSHHEVVEVPAHILN